LTDEINNLQLDNRELRKKIEDCRKEKLAVASLLETMKNQRETLRLKYEELFINNEEALKSKINLFILIHLLKNKIKE
jgi:hypothetical protein